MKKFKRCRTMLQEMNHLQLRLEGLYKLVLLSEDQEKQVKRIRKRWARLYIKTRGI